MTHLRNPIPHSVRISTYVLMASLREQVDLTDIPDVVRGSAMVFLIAGFLSLAFAGFAGPRSGAWGVVALLAVLGLGVLFAVFALLGPAERSKPCGGVGGDACETSPAGETHEPPEGCLRRH